MKNSILLIVVLLCNIAFAQEETLLSAKIESGGYGAFITRIGSINGSAGVFVGGQGAWIINHKFAIGGKGYGLVNQVKIDNQQNAKLEFGTGGVFLEYIFNSHKLFHFNIHSMIGAGAVRYAVIDFEEPFGDMDYSADSFFVIEPGVNVTLNVGKKMRVGTGLTYRFVEGVNYESLTNADLNGVSGEVILKFGVF